MTWQEVEHLAGEDGLIVGVAVDHRDTLLRLLAERGIDADDAFLARWKSQVVAALSPEATLVLIDHEVGLERALEGDSLAPGVAIAVPLEQQGYGTLSDVVVTTMLEGYGPAEARDDGAHAVKLLLPYRVDRGQFAARQQEVARHAVERCRAVGVPLILEPIVVAEPEEDLEPGELGELVVRGAERLALLGPHLLKLQYPGTFERCAQLTRVCGDVPWVLLGGGAAGEHLSQQAEDASRAGARGFIVGRTLWESALAGDPMEVADALVSTSLPLLEELTTRARLGAIAAR